MSNQHCATDRRVFRTIAGVGVLAALAAGSLLGPPAHASLGACGSDPTLTLSNGATLDLNTSIADSVADVQQVAYVVHIPAGARVVAVAYTTSAIGPKETVKTYSDNPADTYDTSTSVATFTPQVAVATSTAAVSLEGISSGSASGMDRQHLLVEIIQ